MSICGQICSQQCDRSGPEVVGWSLGEENDPEAPRWNQVHSYSYSVNFTEFQPIHAQLDFAKKIIQNW
jgi:hypothetical protein